MFKHFILLAALIPQMAIAHPAVIELFTSQGCSSCPAADALVGSYADSADTLVLSFHVDYWNRLGWVDPYSSPQATARQRNYAQYLRSNNVYTPQAVVQGMYDVVGSNRSDVRDAIAKASASTPWVTPQLAVQGGVVRVAVPKGEGKADILLIGYRSHTRNAVPRGENRGVELAHRNSVTGIVRVGAWTGAAFTLDVPKPTGDGMAVLLQSPETGAILGAAWL